MNEVNVSKIDNEKVSLSALKLDADVVLGAYSYDLSGYGKIPQDLKKEFHSYNKRLGRVCKWCELSEDEIKSIQDNSKTQLLVFSELSKVKNSLKDINIIVEFVFNEKCLEYIKSNKLFNNVNMIQGNVVSEKINMLEFDNVNKNNLNKENKEKLSFENMLNKLYLENFDNSDVKIIIFHKVLINTLEKVETNEEIDNIINIFCQEISSNNLLNLYETLKKDMNPSNNMNFDNNEVKKQMIEIIEKHLPLFDTEKELLNNDVFKKMMLKQKDDKVITNNINNITKIDYSYKFE